MRCSQLTSPSPPKTQSKTQPKTLTQFNHSQPHPWPKFHSSHNFGIFGALLRECTKRAVGRTAGPGVIREIVWADPPGHN